MPPSRVRPPLEASQALSQGTVRVGGAEVSFEACAETTVMRDDAGNEEFSIFSVSYSRTGASGGPRPVIYAFDGGPGTSSVTMHLGLLGPRRAAVEGDYVAATLAPPLVDNPHCLLDVADVVVVDAIDTGYSRTAPGAKPRRYHGYTADMEATARFIADHVSRTKRWGSPKFLLGESYGGMRAAGMALHLQDRHGLYLAGTILFAPVLDRLTLDASPGNDLPYVCYLPTMAAAAWHHGRVGQGRPLGELLAEVEDFAVNTYAPALLLGRRLSESRRERIVERLSGYTGLSPAYIESANLRVSDGRFFKELLRPQRLVVSRVDSRFAGVEADAAGEVPERDHFTMWFRRAYQQLMNSYLADALRFETALDYRVYNPRVLPWHFGDVAGDHAFNVAASLRQAIERHPGMGVFIGTGLFDLAVPYFSVENALDRTILEPALGALITTARYPSGHLLYLEEENLKALRQDLVAFIGAAIVQPATGAKATRAVPRAAARA